MQEKQKETTQFDYLKKVANQSMSDKVILGRYFGTPLTNVPIDGLMAFYGTLNQKDIPSFWTETLASKFFVASLYCRLHKHEQEYKAGEVKIEEVLRQIYFKNGEKKIADKLQDKSSEQVRIENLLRTEFTEEGRFEILFKNLINSNIEKFKDIDLCSMQKDLQWWNAKGLNSSKSRWARAIVTYRNAVSADNNNKKE